MVLSSKRDNELVVFPMAPTIWEKLENLILLSSMWRNVQDRHGSFIKLQINVLVQIQEYSNITKPSIMILYLNAQTTQWKQNE